MLSIQLERQGVSQSLRASFGACPHGHSWYVTLQDWQGKRWLCQLYYPNCPECFNPREPRPEWDQVSNESYEAWKVQDTAWRGRHRAGQTAWSNREAFQSCASLDIAKELTLKAIGRIAGCSAKFADKAEAYCCYTDADYRAYPHLAADVFIACATYDPASDTIRHEPTDAVLVQFPGTATIKYDTTGKYRPQIERAYVEYAKEHNQRDGATRAKTRFAWLLSEYIKGEHPGETPVEVQRIERPAVVL
jgi:hypothetical protein